MQSKFDFSSSCNAPTEYSVHIRVFQRATMGLAEDAVEKASYRQVRTEGRLAEYL